MNSDKELDCSGLACPAPVIKAKKELQKMESGQILKVVATDPGARSDIPALIKRIGDEILEVKEEGNKTIFYIKKK